MQHKSKILLGCYIMVLWVMMPCNLVGVCQRLGWFCCLRFTLNVEVTVSYKSALGYNPETQNITLQRSGNLRSHIVVLHHFVTYHGNYIFLLFR
jgi:hypothetical protein